MGKHWWIYAVAGAAGAFVLLSRTGSASAASAPKPAGNPGSPSAAGGGLYVGSQFLPSSPTPLSPDQLAQLQGQVTPLYQGQPAGTMDVTLQDIVSNGGSV
jgi:hypothetical protein